jgi:ABC-type multidrug transport system ATPase subunit
LWFLPAILPNLEDVMSGEAIVVDDVRFSYGKIRAVDGISFTVAPGEIFGFLGPNGAGKSTTIKMLTGMLQPHEGGISVLGIDLSSRKKEVQGRIGVCFEEKNLYIELTAKENLDFFARLFGIRGFNAQAALERVGLADRAKERVKTYSKGMRQRLMVARAFINQPDVLFLDEPTDGLDPVSSRAIRAIVKEEARRGAAVVLTTHDMSEADLLSDRVAFINEGKIVAIDAPENLKIKYGNRSVKVRTRSGDGVDEKSVPLGTSEAEDLLKAAAGDVNLMTIHTEEATLEDIFVEITGRGLA